MNELRTYRAAPATRLFKEVGLETVSPPETLRAMWKARTKEELLKVAPDWSVSGEIGELDLASMRRCATARAAGYKSIECRGQLLVNWLQRKKQFEPPLVYVCLTNGEYTLAFIGRRMAIMKVSEINNKVYKEPARYRRQ